MAELDKQFKNLYFKKKTDESIERKRCKIIYNDSQTNTKSYSFETDSQIWVYYGGDGSKEKPIIDGDQLIKLTIKDKGFDNEYMYVNFINTHIVTKPPNLEEIIRIIKSITKGYNIHKIVLQDDAHFYIDDAETQSVKALYLRALDKTDVNNLSIYSKHNFKPIKSGSIESCVKALRSVKCIDLYKASKEILNILTNINYSTTSVYQIHIQHTNLEVSYTPIKSQELRLKPIFSRYRQNLTQLNQLLTQCDKYYNGDISEFCKIKKASKEEDYVRIHNFLSCLENDVNMNVIIVEGKGDEEKTNSDDTVCDVNKTVDTPTKIPINITKLFNLFYGTFKKIDCLYNLMEMPLKSFE